MKPQFKIGDSLYLITDPKQYKRLCTGITIIAGGSIFYDLAFELEASRHNEIELSNDKDVIMATTNND